MSRRRARTALLALALALAGCAVLEPVLEAQRETLAQVSELQAEVKAANASAAAIEAEYRAGVITQAERDAAIADVRATVLDGFEAVRAALEATGKAIGDVNLADVATEGAKDVAPFLPPPWDSILASLAAIAGAWGITRSESRKRDTARALRGEPVGLPGTVPPVNLLARGAPGRPSPTSGL